MIRMSTIIVTTWLCQLLGSVHVFGAQMHSASGSASQFSSDHALVVASHDLAGAEGIQGLLEGRFWF